MAPSEPVITATEYTLSLLPEGHEDRHHWSVTVSWRGPGKYAVLRHGETYTADGHLEYERQPSSREADYIARTRFPLEQALEIAKGVLPTLTVNGWRIDPETLEPVETERRRAAREATEATPRS